MTSTPDEDGLRQFDRYTIERPLGSGGMATVYAASMRGPGGAARPVALKLIHPHLAREEGFVRMFVEETRMAMAFQHRNIVQTFDAGEVKGRHFMAMERVDGFTLRDLITRLGGRPFPVEMALFVCKEVAAALDYAHTFAPELTGQPGAAIHRDVSPSNVLLSKAGDVKLADFGVARAARGEHSTSTVVKGKVTYMAPEQARGKACPASDVFSLAAVLYELLVQRPLRQVSSIEDVLALPTPEEIHPQREDVPSSVDKLLARSLDVDPIVRPTARELRDALSKELHTLRREGDARDLHDGLADLMRSLPTPVSDPRAQQLARAMLEEARRLETLSDSGPPTAATVIESQRGMSRPGRDPKLLRSARRRALLVIVALGLAGSAAGAALMFHRRETAIPAAHVAHDVGAPPAADASPDLTPSTPDTSVQPPERPSRPDAAAKKVKVNKKKPSPRLRKSKKKTPKKQPTATGRGTLFLNAVPWAHVTIDGKKRGTTPLEGLVLPAGRHRVVLENAEQGLEKTLTIVIRPDETLRRVVNLR